MVGKTTSKTKLLTYMFVTYFERHFPALFGTYFECLLIELLMFVNPLGEIVVSLSVVLLRPIRYFTSLVVVDNRPTSLFVAAELSDGYKSSFSLDYSNVFVFG